MKKAGLILIGVCSVILLGILIFLGRTEGEAAEYGSISIVKAPAQKKPMISEQFKQEEYTAPVIEGENVALGAKATANGYNDVYKANNTVDGARATYWEGSPSNSEDILTVDLKDTHKIYTIVIALNPASIWSKRTQTISFEASTDGENYSEIAAKTKYEFDPKTGNQIVVTFDPVQARYVRAIVTSNSGAVGGQVAEFEIYEK